MTYALIKDSILYGVFLPYQWAWIVCGLASTALLSVLLFIWLRGLLGQLRSTLALYRPAGLP